MSAWHQHLSDSALTAILTRSGAVYDDVAHFADCVYCQRRALELPAAAQSPVLGTLASWTPLVRRVQEQGDLSVRECLYEGVREISRAKELAAEAAASESPEEVLGRETTDGFALARGVIEAVSGLRQDHPERIVFLCRHALERLGEDREEDGLEEPASRHVEAELEAQLQAELGNALRVLGQLREADQGLTQARTLAQYTVSKLTQAKAFRFSASYLEVIGQYDLAESCAKRAIELYRDAGTSREVDIARFLYSSVAFERGDLAEAEERLRTLLDEVDDPLTELSTAFLLAKTYTLQGNPFAGADLLRRVRRLAKAYKSSRSIQITIQWLQALILGGTRSPLKGAELLYEVREHYLEREILLDAALASVDLSMLLLHAGEHRRAAAVAAEALESFKAQPVAFPQALAALRVFEQAVRTERLCHTLYRDTAVQLKQSALDRTTRDWVRRKYG